MQKAFVETTQDEKPHKLLKAMAEWFHGDEDAELKIELLREIVGMSLIGRGTEFQKGLILLGDGENGRSTFLGLLYGVFARRELESVAPQGMDNEQTRALLVDVLINFVDELPCWEIRNPGTLTAFITGDTMMARRLHEKPFTFKAKATHIFACNDLPRVRGAGPGWWRRWIVLPFNNRFVSENAQAGDMPASPYLLQEILRDEKPQIVAWFLAGAAHALARGHLIIPPSCEKALAQWRDTSGDA